MGVEGRGKRATLREDRGAWDGKQGVWREIGRSERSMKAWNGKMGSRLLVRFFLRLPAAYVSFLPILQVLCGVLDLCFFKCSCVVACRTF